MIQSEKAFKKRFFNDLTLKKIELKKKGYYATISKATFQQVIHKISVKQLNTFHLASPVATSQNNVWSLIYIETPSPIIPPESTRNFGYTYASASLLILIFVAIVNPFFVRDGLVMKWAKKESYITAINERFQQNSSKKKILKPHIVCLFCSPFPCILGSTRHKAKIYTEETFWQDVKIDEVTT